jgi:hypothetical protein
VSTITIEHGGSSAYEVQIRDSLGAAVVGVYDGTEPLALEVWPAAGGPAFALIASSASWLVPADGTISLTFDDSDAASLRHGDLARVVLTEGSEPRVVWQATLNVLPGPGSEVAETPSALASALAGPKRVKGSMGEVEQYSLKDLIEADKYLAAKSANGRRGVRFTKLIPPGAV